MTPQETFTPPDSPPTPASTGEAVKRLLASLLTSKKFVATLVGAIVALTAKAGFDVSTETVALIVGLFASFVLAQGQADKGKEAAKLEMQPAFDWKGAAKVGAGVAGGLLPGKAGQVAGRVGEVLGAEASADVLNNHELRLRLLEAKTGLK